MERAFNCLLLGDYSIVPIPIFKDEKDEKDKKFAKSYSDEKIYMRNYTVALLNDYICKKKNVKNLKLWKVNAKEDYIKDNVSTEEDIKNKIKGEEMESDKLFKRYFQNELNLTGEEDDDEEFAENIHIIAIIPTGKCLPTFYLSNKKFAVTKYRFGLISFYQHMLENGRLRMMEMCLVSCICFIIIYSESLIISSLF